MQDLAPLFAVLGKGLIIGWAVAAPVGPVTALCAERARHSGFMAGVFSGVGVALAAAVYAGLAVGGMSLALGSLLPQSTSGRILGGGILILVALRILRAAARNEIRTAKQPDSQVGMVRAVVSAFFISAFNPMTLILIAAVFIGFGVVEEAAKAGWVWALVPSVFGGAFLWGVVVAMLAVALGGMAGPVLLRRLNRISAGMLLGFGVWGLAAKWLG